MSVKIEDVKVGDKITIKHQRKGTFNAEVKSNDLTSEWLDTVVLDKKIKGMVNTWEPGEDLSVRKTLIASIEKIQS